MRVLRQAFLVLILALSLSVDASLVGSVIKVLTHQSDRAALIGKLVATEQIDEYTSAISAAFLGMSRGNAAPSQSDVLRIIEGSGLEDVKKERLLSLLNKNSNELTTDELNEITDSLMVVAHRVDPEGVLLTSCQDACFATGRGLNSTISVIENDAMRAILRKYPSEQAQRTRINTLLRKTRMGTRMGSNTSIVTNNGTDTRSMLLFLEILDNQSDFPADTVNLAKSLKEFSKKADGSYDLFDSSNQQRLYRLIVELEENEHGKYAQHIGEVANSCASQYPKKDCFYSQISEIAKRNGVEEDQVARAIDDMKIRRCFFQ